MITGILFAIFNIARVLKFRIYDDIDWHKIYGGTSDRYTVPDKDSHLVLRGILDHIPRAYLYIAFSFTILQLLIMKSPWYVGPEIADAFVIKNSSGNPFVDFFYGNVPIVGYGEISPRSALAKLVGYLGFMFMYLVFPLIFGMYIYRITSRFRTQE